MAKSGTDTSPMGDTYFYLVERPAARQFGLCSEEIDHRTAIFDQACYSRSIGLHFADPVEAYAHWVRIGRREGATYAMGRDSTLKIILKAKDEPRFIDRWITHHANIVGRENLVILDCGSSDPEYLAKLDQYRGSIIILDYPRYYNDIHTTRSNKSFYKLISDSCRYLTVLDADEFLVGYDGQSLGAHNVKKLLRELDKPIFFGIWLNNANRIGDENGVIDWSDRLPLRLDHQSFVNGAVAGKCVVRSDKVFDIAHLGHNMHVPGTVAAADAESLGKLFVIHVRNLNPKFNKKRVTKHLVTKGAIPADLSDETEIDRVVFALRNEKDLRIDIAKYVNEYVRTCEQSTESGYGQPETTALGEADYDIAAYLDDVMAEANLPAVLMDRRAKLGVN